MRFSLDTYAANRAAIRRYVKPNMTEQDVELLVQRMVMMTMCPVIVVWYYVGEIIGFTEQVRQQIKSLKAFYHIDHIDGAPDGE